MIVNWRQHEPTLEDILSDSIIKAVMKADGVDPHQLAATLKEAGRRCRLNKQGAGQTTTPGMLSRVAGRGPQLAMSRVGSLMTRSPP